MTDELDVTRKDLKIQALRETNASLTNENADLRVELHLHSEALKQAQDKVNKLEGQLEEARQEQEAQDSTE